MEQVRTVLGREDRSDGLDGRVVLLNALDVFLYIFTMYLFIRRQSARNSQQLCTVDGPSVQRQPHISCRTLFRSTADLESYFAASERYDVDVDVSFDVDRAVG